MKKRAQVRVALEALASLLHLRESLSITGIHFDPDFRMVRIYVEGECLPEIAPRDCSRNYELTDLMRDFI